mmetsp:Transcript_24032/g.36985  ORF Transcript_24032/g.36985 Transcript_24032/m.36985 type:complete len:98 (-) Transcript_24032:73-366(-)|eukprot:CAMPEP_0170489258 /NCGR_PEP_ID=MMETSP0208-20121228/7631_1 /TAXON_ID=197538 /ORGANISM="Strombidium inclinatum, Strain S3" /LENGTH=97 /DNA_ID=CAMNT_0010764101 /DNA_START=176 /DNA_END=469 /DNA_ORIENTATION=+
MDRAFKQRNERLMKYEESNVIKELRYNERVEQRALDAVTSIDLAKEKIDAKLNAAEVRKLENKAEKVAKATKYGSQMVVEAQMRKLTVDPEEAKVEE